jgi:hypothetical protein
MHTPPPLSTTSNVRRPRFFSNANNNNEIENNNNEIENNNNNKIENNNSYEIESAPSSPLPPINTASEFSSSAPPLTPPPPPALICVTWSNSLAPLTSPNPLKHLPPISPPQLSILFSRYAPVRALCVV